MILHLGNPNPLHEVQPDVDPDTLWCMVDFPDGVTVHEAMTTVTDPQGVWAYQSADTAPSWVASDNADLESDLAAYYNVSIKPVSGLNAA